MTDNEDPYIADMSDDALDADEIDKIDFGSMEIMRRLRKDLKSMARELGDEEIKALIETYYMLQRDRIRIGNRLHALYEGLSEEQPSSVLGIFHQEFRNLEDLMKAPIDAYVKSRRVGRWLSAQKGIGPILAGAFLSGFDITVANGPGSYQRFCGIDPTIKWEKGQPRPFNAFLKKTCYLAGESFVKVSNREGATYGIVYRTHKKLEEKKNENGQLVEAAQRYLDNMHRVHGPDVEKKKEWVSILSKGKLPPFLIDKRARRKAISLFINHLWEVTYEVSYNQKPNFKHYVFDHLNHKDYIAPPNWPVK